LNSLLEKWVCESGQKRPCYRRQTTGTSRLLLEMQALSACKTTHLTSGLELRERAGNQTADKIA